MKMEGTQILRNVILVTLSTFYVKQDSVGKQLNIATFRTIHYQITNSDIQHSTMAGEKVFQDVELFHPPNSIFSSVISEEIICNKLP
jgi:hypothetical protein